MLGQRARRKLGVLLALASVPLIVSVVALSALAGQPGPTGPTGADGVGNPVDCHGANTVTCGVDPQPTHGVDCFASDDHVCPSDTPSPSESPSPCYGADLFTCDSPSPTAVTTTPPVVTSPPSVIPPTFSSTAVSNGREVTTVKKVTVGKGARTHTLAFTGPREDLARNGLIGLNLILFGLALLRWTSKKTLAQVRR
jgi:hypothetical protein